MSWTTLLWALLPDDAFPLVILLAALLFLIGLRRTACGLLAVALLVPILGPFVEALMAGIPPWVSLLILVVFIVMLLQFLATAVLGHQAAAHMVGILAADMVRFALRCVFLPLRWLLTLCRALVRGGS
jgi:hypothetical protein